MSNKDRVWTIGEIIEQTKQYLAKYDVSSPRLDAEILLCSILQQERIYLYVNFDQPLQKSEVDLYRELVVRRVKGESIAYILGKKSFLNLELYVNTSVLVPRPETELLAEVAINFCKKHDGVSLLDIGTGSGTLAISIAYNCPDVTVVAVDVSQDALTVAEKNAQKYEVMNRIDFMLSDVYDSIVGKKFDLIVSNPPYILSKEIKTLSKEVQKEPVLALDGGEDGLDIYRKIVGKAMSFLSNEGLLALEIGYDQASALEQLAIEAGFKQTKVLKDLAGLDRVVLMSNVLID